MRVAGVLALGALLGAGAAEAHNLELTETVVVFASDGRFTAEMTCDLDALALGAAPSADDAELAGRLAALAPDELRARLDGLTRLFERRVRVRFDGEPAPFAVDFPDRHLPAPPSGVPSFLGTTARLTGRAPSGWEEMTFFASRAFPPVHLTVLDAAGPGGVRHLVERGAESDPVRRDEMAAPRSDAWTAAGRYLALGFRHILPDGLDHILFVVGLFLLAARWRPLLWQVTAFTAAHTLTLALSTFGVVSLPAGVVEPLIALSIAWVAIENVVTRDLKPWRPAVVFGFGLLHGLGFAGALAELGLAPGERLWALVGFNAGVELGQLAILAAAFLTLGLLRHRPWYRARITVPLSLAIAAVGLIWAVERVL